MHTTNPNFYAVDEDRPDDVDDLEWEDLRTDPDFETWLHVMRFTDEEYLAKNEELLTRSLTTLDAMAVAMARAFSMRSEQEQENDRHMSAMMSIVAHQIALIHEQAHFLVDRYTVRGRERRQMTDAFGFEHGHGSSHHKNDG